MSYRHSGLALLLLAAAPVALPHGAGYEREPEAPTEVLRFRYAAGGAMDGAQVRVLHPGGGLYQVGRTDPSGRFAFVPDRPGEWLLETDDGQGHQLQARVPVGTAAAAAPSARRVAVPPLALAGALLASVLLNAGLFSAWRAQKKPRQ